MDTLQKTGASCLFNFAANNKKKAKHMKLTDTAEILQLMDDGWEMGWFDGIRSEGRFAIQRGGLCKGGESKNIHASTAKKMIRLGLVVLAPRKDNDRFCLRRYTKPAYLSSPPTIATP